MQIALSKEQESLRLHLREYFASLVTPEYRAEMATSEGGGPLYHRVVKQMGKDGWLGIGWPKEYGGQGRTPIEQFIFFDEAMYAGVMVPTLTLNAVAPSIMQHASEEQKKTILMVTHDPRAAERASALLHLDKGVLVEAAQHDAVRLAAVAP